MDETATWIVAARCRGGGRRREDYRRNEGDLENRALCATEQIRAERASCTEGDADPVPTAVDEE